MKNKKNIIIISVMLLLVFFISGRFVKNKGEKQKTLKEEEIKNSFEYRYNEFQKIYKSGYLFCLEGNSEKAEQELSKSLSIWNDIVKDFSNTIPVHFTKTRNWENEMKTILEHVEAGYEFASLGECKRVVEQTKAVSQKLNAISTQNNIISISPDLIQFGEYVELIRLAKNKKDAEDAFLNLKLIFTGIKELKKEEEYKNKIAELESVIAKLDMSEGEEWFLAREKLVELNKEVFLEFE